MFSTVCVRRVRKPTASIFQDRGVDPGLVDRTADVPGARNRIATDPGQVRGVRQTAGPSAQRRVLYARASAAYYVHHSRVYPRDVCTSSSYASNDEKKRGRNRGGGGGGGGREVEEARKRDERVRDEARKASSRSMKRERERERERQRVYRYAKCARQRFASFSSFILLA